MKESSHLVFITNLKKGLDMSHDDFESRIKAVYVARDNWISLIESRLKDLTGLRLAKKNKYQYLYDDNINETPIKRSGKETIVVFPTDLIGNDLRTDDQFQVWTFILGRIGTGNVFEKGIKFGNKELSDKAQAQLEAIQKEVLRFDDGDFGISDILGVFSDYEHTIKLFAQVIAYHSILLKVEAEDLAFVVLAHELAHAYTIAGYDINGYRGEILQNYHSRKRNVVEGLAQYYAEAVCSQLREKYPQFQQAFEALLKNQTHPYTWHKDWLKRRGVDHEYIRSTLLDYRRFINSEAFERAVL